MENPSTDAERTKSELSFFEALEKEGARVFYFNASSISEAKDIVTSNFIFTQETAYALAWDNV